MTSELKPCPCREAFEKWFEKSAYLTEQEMKGERDMTGGYEDPSIDRDWRTWQAAWNTRHGEK